MSQFEKEVRNAFENYESNVEANAWSDFEKVRGAATSGSFLKQFVVAGVILAGTAGFLVNQNDGINNTSHLSDHTSTHIINETTAGNYISDVNDVSDSSSMDAESTVEIITISSEKGDDKMAVVSSIEEVSTENLTKEDKEALISLNKKIKNKTSKKLNAKSNKSEKNLVTEYKGKKFNLNASQDFSPNGDLENDTFMPEGIKSSDDFILNIYDEHDSLIFSTTSIDRPWRGQTVDGLNATKGEYKWKAIISMDNSSKIFNGIVLLEK